MDVRGEYRLRARGTLARRDGVPETRAYGWNYLRCDTHVGEYNP